MDYLSDLPLAELVVARVTTARPAAMPESTLPTLYKAPMGAQSAAGWGSMAGVVSVTSRTLSCTPFGSQQLDLQRRNNIERTSQSGDGD